MQILWVGKGTNIREEFEWAPEEHRNEEAFGEGEEDEGRKSEDVESDAAQLPNQCDQAEIPNT